MKINVLVARNQPRASVETKPQDVPGFVEICQFQKNRGKKFSVSSICSFACVRDIVESEKIKKINTS